MNPVLMTVVLASAAICLLALGVVLHEAYEAWRAKRALDRILKQVQEDTRVMQAAGRRF